MASAPECPGFTDGTEAGPVTRADTRRGSSSRGVSPLRGSSAKLSYGNACLPFSTGTSFSSVMPTPVIATLPRRPASAMNRSIWPPVHVSKGPCMCRTSMLITAACANGWLASTASPPTTYPIISAGVGRSTPTESSLRTPYCSPLLAFLHS